MPSVRIREFIFRLNFRSFTDTFREERKVAGQRGIRSRSVSREKKSAIPHRSPAGEGYDTGDRVRNSEKPEGKRFQNYPQDLQPAQK